MLKRHSSTADRDQVIETMVTLTHLSRLSRAIITGPDSMGLYVDLRRRGFVRVGLPSRFGLRNVTYAIGLMIVQKSLAEFDAALTKVAPSLGATAMVAVLIKSGESGFALKVRKKLEQLGFRIEAGVRCSQGLVLSAHRQNFAQMQYAA